MLSFNSFYIQYFRTKFRPTHLSRRTYRCHITCFCRKRQCVGTNLMIVFSILYGIISFRFRYWGEMITYLAMTMPMAVWSTITWLKNPSKENKNEVQIQKLTSTHIIGLIFFGIIITAVFYFILLRLNTPNLLFSTISITTSFVAVSLTMLRSSYYAVVYAANDIVLIVLWSLASVQNPVYIPVTINFVIFFLNDVYGFINWKKRELKQS